MHNDLKRPVKYSSIFPLNMYENRYFSYISTKTMAEDWCRIDMRRQLTSIKPDAKAMYTNVKQCHSNKYFFYFGQI